MKYTLLFAAAIAAVSALAVRAQDHGQVEVSVAVRHDSLPSLRHTPPQADGYKRWHEHAEHALPMPNFPAGQSDGAVQGTTVRAPVAATLQTSVDGVGNGFSGPQGAFTVQYAPPDTVGAVGATQYVQIVNVGLAVFDKATKAVVYGPVPTSTLWVGFGGECETDNDGDAIVAYDKVANRWIISQFAVGTAPYLQCVAVSQTSDATGAWFRYAFSYGSVFPDYPKMGVWPDGYYETFNMFTGNTFSGSQLCAYDRSAMLAGAAATQQCFQLASSFGGVLPSDLDGPNAPPSGAPNYLINYGANSLNLWKFHVDWANSANSTLTGPSSLAVAAFTPACGGGVCIPQPGTHQQLDSLADRVMHRLAYRNFGDHESLVVNQSVTVGTNHKNPYSGVRWYEIRSPGATPAVYQQSTFSPDTDYRWMGSIAMDGQGNIALGYSVSSDTTFPAVRYTGRLTGDALGTLQAETSIVEGTGSQSGQNLDRWGDYSGMTIDPFDDCTFWYTNEYLKTTDAFNWSTRVASLAFPGCSAGKQNQTVNFTSVAPATASYNGAPYVATAAATSGLPVRLAVAAASAAVCSISGTASGSQVTFIGVGSCAIEASQAGSTAFNAAPLVQQSFVVGKGTQTVAFVSLAPVNASYHGTTYTVAATSTSGLAVVLAIDVASMTVCQLDGSTSGSHVSFMGVGNCAINADQSGNANYVAASQAQQSFTVGQATQTISFDSAAPANAAIGGPTYHVLASSSSTLAVAVAIDASAAAVCQLDGSTSGSGVSFSGIGTCTINATQGGNVDVMAAAPAQQSFAVGPGAPAQLQFTTQPQDPIPSGGILGTIAVTEEDAVGNVIDDNASVVAFTFTACSGTMFALGNGTMAHGVATLDSHQHFYTSFSPSLSYQVTAKTGALTGTSANFSVEDSGAVLFANSFDGCQP